ncbi:MAG: hypothetical protein JNK49_10295 [Planctomycetes bacterium]|nr:hypothetical protein [Planctomycetota bacterium]
MKVLVIPEDQTNDQYILKPVVERLFEELGRSARVSVLPEPRLRGAEHALDPSVVRSIVADNRAMVDLFLLVVDRDCDRQKNGERLAAREREHPDVLVGCLAVEELECWLLAVQEGELPAAWAAIRADCDPKERYAEPFLQALESVGPGGGRKAAMRGLRGKWGRLLQLCPEVRSLQERIRGLLGGR